MNKKLQEIGKKLNITDKDIQEIQRGFISKKILAIIVGVAIVILAFILWLLWKKQTGPTPPSPPPSPGYPFSPPEVPTPTSPSTPTPTFPTTPTPPSGGYPFAPLPIIMGGYLLTKKKSSKVLGFLISAIAFLSSLIAYPVFGQAILYNVYKKKKLKDFLTALITIPVFGQAIKYNVYSRK